jgi:hypothetical protein
MLFVPLEVLPIEHTSPANKSSDLSRCMGGRRGGNDGRKKRGK